jgi:RNA polymerase sigma-70 factor, ECF subfamily
MKSEPADQCDEHFVEMLVKYQLRIRSYVFALIRNGNYVDDVMQNTWMTLWRKRNEYDAGRDFLRWACGVALNEVLRFRRKLATDKLLFDESLVHTLATEYIEQIEVSDRRRLALADCIQKLTSGDRYLLEARYNTGTATAQIAEELGKPLSTIYCSLTRIRETLYRCVRNAIAKESAQ